VVPTGNYICHEQRPCVGDCFLQGSALSIPWPDNSFDAIISSDVLEHIAPDDIPVLVQELHRVSRSLVILLIAPREEIDHKQLNTVSHYKA
jgi:ubiquinone/menaquinone biosynthesis C-methylase UbiE